MGCVKHLYVWHFDSELRLIQSNCPNEQYWNSLFHSSDICTAALAHCHTEQAPILLSDQLELLWIVAPCYDNNSLASIHMLGPVFISSITEKHLEQLLRSKVPSLSFQRELLAHLKELPVITHTTFMLFGTMLYYCLTNEYITISDIQIADNSPVGSPISSDSFHSNEGHTSGEYEALMLKLIEDGNLSYKKILSEQGTFFAATGTLAEKDSLRQFQNEIITAVTLCTRAAIRGGLPREISLSLSDHYIQSIENATTISDVITIKNLMQEDFTNRVHKIKQLRSVSPAIRSCLQIIDEFIKENLTMDFLSSKVGYTPYYLSSLFQKEMSISVSCYIKKKKIEYAQVLLQNSSKSIAEISDYLHFSSPSYFISVFKKEIGMTPKKFRINS